MSTPQPAYEELPAADRLELTDLVERYAALVDDRDFDAVAALFTEDAVLRQPRPPKRMEPSDTVVGRAAIEANFAQLTALHATQHAIVGAVFTSRPGGDTRATGRVSAVAHHVSGRSGPNGELTDHAWHLVYRDEYRKDDEVWRIAERILDLRWIERRRVASVRSRRGPDHS